MNDSVPITVETTGQNMDFSKLKETKFVKKPRLNLKNAIWRKQGRLNHVANVSAETDLPTN